MESKERSQGITDSHRVAQPPEQADHITPWRLESACSAAISSVSASAKRFRSVSVLPRMSRGPMGRACCLTGLFSWPFLHSRHGFPLEGLRLCRFLGGPQNAGQAGKPSVLRGPGRHTNKCQNGMWGQFESRPSFCPLVLRRLEPPAQILCDLLGYRYHSLLLAEDIDTTRVVFRPTHRTDSLAMDDDLEKQLVSVQFSPRKLS